MTGHRSDSHLSLFYIEIDLVPIRTDHKSITRAYKENANANGKYCAMWHQQKYEYRDIYIYEYLEL